MQSLYNYNICKAIKKELRQRTIISDLANLKPTESKYDTRQHDRWLVPRSRTNYGDQMLRNVIPKMLNYLSGINMNIENMTSMDAIALFL